MFNKLKTFFFDIFAALHEKLGGMIKANRIHTEGNMYILVQSVVELDENSWAL